MNDTTHFNPDHVPCLTMKHAWSWVQYDGDGPREWRETRSATIVQFECLRGCKVKRYDIWSRVTGDSLGCSYRRPQGYGFPRGKRNPKGRSALARKEFIRTQL